MQNTASILENYLVARGFDKPNEDVEDAILKDDGRLAAIAQMYETFGTALHDLLDSRMQPIREELVMRATPMEVMPLRQALAELAAVEGVAEKYAEEHKKREEQRKREGTEVPAEDVNEVDNGTT